MLFTLLRRYTKPYRGHIIAVVVLQLISVLAILYLPSLNARIIDEGVATGDTDFIWRTGGVMLLVALAQIVSAVIAVYFGSQAAMALGRDLRGAVYASVDRFGAQEISEYGPPTLITRGTNDVQQVQMLFVMIMNFMVTLPLMVIGGIVMALQEDVGLSWLVVVAAPLVVGIMAILVRWLIPLFTVMQDKVDAINGVLREQIMGIRVIRAFVREPHETQRFDDANHSITGISVKIGRIFVLMGPILTIILHGAEVAVLWFGGHRVDAGQMEVGSLTAFLQYLMQILLAVMMGSFMAMMFPRAIICGRRIGQIIETVPAVGPAEHLVTPEARRGIVEFRDVEFHYPGAEDPVLTGLSFRAEPGTTTAIIGSTGAGKTTALHLIPRLHDATHGQVLLDGVDVRRLAPAEITDRVAIVPQKPYLFSGTVATNLRFGRSEATDEEMWEALRISQAEDFVRHRSTGEGPDHATDLESGISQGGTNVSGGQRQRLCIARAVVSRPAVYLFDDSFSALDVATDARLRDALTPVTRDATVIIVAQRVSTITGADQILVLDAGRIVARGTHRELLASSETYQEIVESQLSAEEAS
ncbi:ABC transporter ATP-binding protein [Curtobacterium sp. S6]|uniref:ABC transporter ATP-binding protein n=1 Tax=Curtobacterium sp. S6 TaxID=1479623 RepID=UPI0004AAF8D1|nr:ABC transporter ATP-binding protein [Curtobacterium sp. S6]